MAADVDNMPHEPAPRLPWGVVIAAVAGLLAAGAGYAGVQSAIAVQGEQIKTLQRDFGDLQTDVRAALKLPPRRSETR